ncbi:MAG: hypothetical protein IJ074_12100, partial [Clostridia bacterium]|nr:hypothetical protein [Clostridia bacterium]
MANNDFRSPRDDRRRTGAGRRTWGQEGAGPRVGRVYANVPPARRADEAYEAKRNGGGYAGKPADEDPAFLERDPKKRNARKGEYRGGAAAQVSSELLQEIEDGRLLAGRNPIREALKAGRPVEKVLAANGDLSGAAKELLRMAREAGAVVQMVDRARLDQIYPAHQGILAYVAAVSYSTVEEILDEARSRNEPPFLLLLDGITDPHNLGAIIR